MSQTESTWLIQGPSGPFVKLYYPNRNIAAYLDTRCPLVYLAKLLASSTAI